jgi:hypothetical protein
MTGLPGIEMCSIALSMPGGTENEGWGIYFSKVQVNSPSQTHRHVWESSGPTETKRDHR